MINVDVESKVLLDKLYNLRSKDSVILSKMEDERSIAEQTKNRTAEEKLDLAAKVKVLSDEEVLLAKEGHLLTEALKNINKESFGVVFNKLNIDFDPQMLCEKVEATLPSTIDDIKKDILSSNEKLESIVKDMNDAITKIDELGIRKDEAISNQSKLNEYFELALAGNINITRDALTTLLSKFNLSNDEQRECAKLLMFPEDGLYEYNEMVGKRAGKSFSDVFNEAKNIEPISPIKLETEDIHPIKLEEPVISPIKLNVEAPIFEPISINELPKEEPIIAPIVFEPVTFDPIIDEKPIFEPIKLEEKINPVQLSDEKVNVSEQLANAGFKISDFSLNDISFIEEKFDKATFLKNVEIVSELGLNSDIFSENIELFCDPELEEKLSTLINVGKVPFDIYLNPNVLVKYDASELKKSINSLKESGLDPKKVPLMAF